MFETRGNDRVNGEYEANIPTYYFDIKSERPCNVLRERFIKDKYVHEQFKIGGDEEEKHDDDKEESRQL